MAIGRADLLHGSPPVVDGGTPLCTAAASIFFRRPGDIVAGEQQPSPFPCRRRSAGREKPARAPCQAVSRIKPDWVSIAHAAFALPSNDMVVQLCLNCTKSFKRTPALRAPCGTRIGQT